MLVINDIPKEPEDALQFLLVELISLINDDRSDMKKLREARHPTYKQIFTLLRAINVSARKVEDSELGDFVIEGLECATDHNFATIRKNASHALDACLASNIDSHFINADDIQDFDSADLDKHERKEIRAAINNAKSLTANATFLPSLQKRRMNFWLSLAENELMKEKVGFAAFLSVSYQASALLRQFGKDAEPLANAIERARTSTERKVAGENMLEVDPKPKQIEKHD